MKAFYTRNKTDEHTLTHSNFVYLIMNLVLFVVMGEHQGNMRSKYLYLHVTWKLWRIETVYKYASFIAWATNGPCERNDRRIYKFLNILRVLIRDILDSFSTGSSQEDTDLLDFKAQRLQTDSALEDITGWRQFSGEDMFRSKEPSFWKIYHLSSLFQ